MTPLTAKPATPAMSVIIPVGKRHSDIKRLYHDYVDGLRALDKPYEMIFVLDGPRPAAASALRQLLDAGEKIIVITLTRAFGEATALMAGFQRASAPIIVTLPAYDQIEPREIATLVSRLDQADLVIGYRWPRAGTAFETLRRAGFHRLIAAVTGQRYRDLGCGARAMKRRVLEEIVLYGDQYRFLPVLAHCRGFRVVEAEVRQSPRDRHTGGYRTREYLHRALDIFTIFFLVRFTHKPLRFFGIVGATTFGAGALLTSWLVIERLFLNRALADRPALLLSSLLVVLGMQIFALGLLGELIIFTHARHIKDYQIDEVVRFPQEQQPADARELISH
jgi:glycosyltransferase involved in cell wall biosynthesis